MVGKDGTSEGERDFTRLRFDGENNIEKLVSESEVDNPKYVDHEKWERLKNGVKWMGTALEFYWLCHGSSSSLNPVVADSLVLGLSNKYVTSEAVATDLGAGYLKSAADKYDVELSDDDFTRKFMEKVAVDDDIKAVFFMVPEYMYSYSESANQPWATHTRDEFNFLLDHPEMAGKVYLVFGGLEAIETRKFDDENETLRGQLYRQSDMNRERVRLVSEIRRWVRGLVGRKS